MDANKLCNTVGAEDSMTIMEKGMKRARTGEDYSDLEVAETLNNYLKYECYKLQESITDTQVYNYIKIAIRVLKNRKEVKTNGKSRNVRSINIY